MADKLTDNELLWMALGDGTDVALEGWKSLTTGEPELKERWDRASTRAKTAIAKTAFLLKHPFIARCLLETKRAFRSGLGVLNLNDRIVLELGESSLTTLKVVVDDETLSQSYTFPSSDEGVYWMEMNVGDVVSIECPITDGHLLKVVWFSGDGSESELDPVHIEEFEGGKKLLWKLEEGEAPLLLQFEVFEDTLLLSKALLALVEREGISPTDSILRS